MDTFFKKTAESKWFSNLIIVAILVAGVVVGIQTYGSKVAAYHDLLNGIDLVILLLFTIEAAIKILAEADRPWRYFQDPWNVFDFLIVSICWAAMFMPGVDAGFVAVFRLARVLRVLRLVSALPQLKMLVDAMLKSIPSMGYVGILLLLLFYIYGVMGVFLFGKNDPIHFGDLTTALVTLFQIVTLEGWADIMNINVFGCDHPTYGTEDCTAPAAAGVWALVYFISFVLVGTMIVLNLFIGVIMNSMDEVRAEQKIEEKIARADSTKRIEDELNDLHDMLDDMKKQLDLLAFRFKKE